ncbi:MAG: cytochrome c-type biogenesis protein CcmH [Gammaproteobacteria bacterium]|nr:cytochrome c-type biogenesis protein CcmH [Gammaproteobacteria bacterium]
MLVAGWCLSLQAATVEPRIFDNPEQESRYKRLIVELRCLVCQNQNIADSNADLAMDLRRETYNMIRGGKTDEQIVTFMVDRYGDFVLYRPPVKPTTYLLWAGPLLLVGIGFLIMLMHIRRRGTGHGSDQLSAEERKRLDKILAGNGQEKDR